MATREIVTLQVGHYANYVGTHFWNLQSKSFSFDPNKPSEINHDVLFREGSTRNGLSTFLPRVISVDLKGSLCSLKEDGVLYDDQTDKLRSYSWDGNVDEHKAEAVEKNDFLQDLDKEEASPSLQMADADKDMCHGGASSSVPPKSYDLDESVKSWTDFMMMHLHPRSIHIINEYSHESEVRQFDVFHQGQQLFQNDLAIDDMGNKIRYFLEECDQLQGFQLVVDMHDGFAGVGSTLGSYLNDEYPNKDIVAVPVFDVSRIPVTSAGTVSTVLMNALLCYERLAALDGLVLPVSCVLSCTHQHLLPASFRSFPLLNYKGNLPYHSSSILAATLDTVTAAYRLKDRACHMHDVVAATNIYGRKMAAVSSIFPLPVEQNQSIVHSFMDVDPSMIPVSLTPSCDILSGVDLTQIITLRGIPPNLQIVCFEDSSDAGPISLDDMLNSYITKMLYSSRRSIWKMAEPCQVSAPFPNIFDSKITAHGLVSRSAQADNNHVATVPLLCGIHSNSSISTTLNSLLADVTKINLKKLHRFSEAGFEIGEFSEILENIKTLSSFYSNLF